MHYLRPQGDMATGWVNGAPVLPGWPGHHGHRLAPVPRQLVLAGQLGAMAVGWTNIGNDWYLFEDDGRHRLAAHRGRP